MVNFREACISRKLFLIGEPDFILDDFNELKIGDKVIRIGLPGRNGKPTSGSRVDEWGPWVQYAGKLKYQWPGVDHPCRNICFRIPPGGIVPDPGPCYVVYIIVNKGELMRNEYGQSQSVRLFRASFEKYIEQPIIKTINKMKLFDYFKANNFFPQFCPNVKNYKGKMRGKNTKGAPLEFTPQDVIDITAGIEAWKKLAFESLLADPAGTLTSISFNE